MRLQITKHIRCGALRKPLVESRTRGELAEKRTALKNDKRKKNGKEKREAKEEPGREREAPRLTSSSITNI